VVVEHAAEAALLFDPPLGGADVIGGEEDLVATPLMIPLPFPPAGNGPVRRRDRLGGMPRYYYREAA
jgi:hypothetical protein